EHGASGDRHELAGEDAPVSVERLGDQRRTTPVDQPAACVLRVRDVVEEPRLSWLIERADEDSWCRSGPQGAVEEMPAVREKERSGIASVEHVLSGTRDCGWRAARCRDAVEDSWHGRRQARREDDCSAR